LKQARSKILKLTIEKREYVEKSDLFDKLLVEWGLSYENLYEKQKIESMIAKLREPGTVECSDCGA
jgi:hypothetical protein